MGGVPLHRSWNKKIFAHKVRLYGSSGTKPRCFDPVRICSRGVQLTQKLEPILSTEQRLLVLSHANCTSLQNLDHMGHAKMNTKNIMYDVFHSSSP